MRVRAHLDRGEFAQALSAGQPLLREIPQNRDLLYMIAVSQRYLHRIPDALATLDVLERYHPAYSRLFQERGHCHVATRSAAPAITAFLRAVNLNPSLPASWNALQALFRMTGQGADADYAADQVAKLASLPPEIATAFSMFADGEIYDAERVVRQYLLTHGDHVEGMRLLAKIGVELDVLDDAEILLENLLVLAPNHDVARYEYAIVLLKRHKHVRAREEMEKLLQADPDNRMYRTTHATVCTGFGDYDKALPLYREILAESPQEAELHLSIAHALKTLGQTQDAVESYRAAAAARPYFGEAYWSLANLKTYRFTDAELDRMRADEASPEVRLVDRASEQVGRLRKVALQLRQRHRRRNRREQRPVILTRARARSATASTWPASDSAAATPHGRRRVGSRSISSVRGIDPRRCCTRSAGSPCVSPP